MTKRERGKEIKGRKEKQKPKCKIYIFTEGNTEEIYLKHFENRIYNVEVKSVDPKHTNAYGIVKFAMKYLEENKLELDYGDRGYCVFDSDPKSNANIKEVFQLLFPQKDRGLEFIFSNPCFEVWFALHFGKAPYGFTAEQMKKYVKDKLKNKYPKYSETTDVYDYLLEWQNEAAERAERLHKQQEQVHKTVYSHECNPYTNIFEFIKHMEKIKQERMH